MCDAIYIFIIAFFTFVVWCYPLYILELYNLYFNLCIIVANGYYEALFSSYDWGKKPLWLRRENVVLLGNRTYPINLIIDVSIFAGFLKIWSLACQKHILIFIRGDFHLSLELTRRVKLSITSSTKINKSCHTVKPIPPKIKLNYI